MVMFFGCIYAALPAVILWPVEVWTANVRTTGSASSRERRVSRTVVPLPVIALCVVSRLPKADRQDTIRFYGYVCWIGFWLIRGTAGPERLFMVGWFAGFVLSPLHTLWATSESEPMLT